MEKIRTEKKTSAKNSAGRLIMAILAFLLQIVWIEVLVLLISRYSALINLVWTVIALIIVLKMYGQTSSATIRLPWIIFMLALPVMGVPLYFLYGRSVITKKARKRFDEIGEETKQYMIQDKEVADKLASTDLGVSNEFRYLYNHMNFPVYTNSKVEYHGCSEDGIESLIETLKLAKKFIFMEYHAIEDAVSFGRIKDVLISKAAAGVEVRLFYDDVGSIFFLNTDFIKEMREKGIDCRVFNPVRAIFNIFMNNRDHRKITVVDGLYAVTGGYNLADEYFNITHPYGEWYDTGIKVTGEAVHNYTIIFLAMWNGIKKTDETIDKYIDIDYSEVAHLTRNCDYYVCPYADSPLGKDRVGENVYLNIIKNAKKYVYITTPYLIITDEMRRELTLAARRGVDVRLVTPGIPDKKVTYSMTRSYYPGLVKHGVRIYEFTPGFMHAKQWVCDDEICAVNTINMDFRSLYHHFENGTLIYNRETAVEIRRNFEKLFARSEDVSAKYADYKHQQLRLSQCILRLVSPLF